MTGISARVTSSEGVAELIGRSAEIDSEALVQFLATPGVAGSALEAEIRDALSVGADDAVEAVSRQAIAQALYKLFHPKREHVVDHEERRIPLEAFRLYVPPAAGAGIELAISSEQARSGTAAFKIVPIGGSRAWTLTITDEITRDASTSEQIDVTAPAAFDIIEYRQGSKVLATYPRLQSIDANNLNWSFRPLDTPTVPSPDRRVRLHEFDQRLVRAGTTTVAVTMAKGTSWDLSVGIDIPKIGAEFTASVGGSYTTSIALKCSLPDEHFYVAQQFSGIPGYIWTIEDDHT